VAFDSEKGGISSSETLEILPYADRAKCQGQNQYQLVTLLHIVAYRPVARQRPRNDTTIVARIQLRKYATVLEPLLGSVPFPQQ
jgi:hypothetical protein